MPQLSSRCLLGLVVLILIVYPAFLLGRNGPEAVKPLEKAETKYDLTPVYFGSEGCTPCHNTELSKVAILAKGDELVKWRLHDKHRLATKVLFEERSQAMGKILKITVSEDPKCLACHGVTLKGKTADETYDKVTFTKEMREADGVTCVVCHGPTNVWIEKHALLVSAAAWRARTRQQKEEVLGFKDLWSPIKRAELCASCHVGNLADGKFVTHEMYAAGHPPLPGFEAALFSDEMPKHWSFLRDKTEPAKKVIDRDGIDQNCEQTRLLLIGGLVSLRESMKLLKFDAEAALKAGGDDDRAMNLSSFDCYACHHDLKGDRIRQQAGFAGKPGRVPMKPWPSVLVKLAISDMANDAEGKKLQAEFEGLEKKVRLGFDAQPFGDPKMIAAAADDLSTWANKQAEILSKKQFPKETPRKLLGLLPALYANDRIDYDSARQIAWAVKVLSMEMNDLEKKPNPVTKEFLDKMETLLKIKLPSGQTKIEEELAARLKVRNDFDAKAFKELLGQLSVTAATAK